MAILLIAISGLIAAYQTGMQLGLLPDLRVCEVDHPYKMGSAMMSEVLCTDMGWTLFGMSLAAYNALLSLTVATLGAVLLAKSSVRA